MISLSTAVGGVLCFFHPLAAEGSWIYICVLRVLTGIVQGSVYPCVHTLLSKWVPRTERGFLTTGTYSGAQFGTAVILVSSGHIFESVMGWPGLFYISGGLSVFWALLFFWQGANEPATAKYISKIEREYIENLTGSNNTGEVSVDDTLQIIIARLVCSRTHIYIFTNTCINFFSVPRYTMEIDLQIVGLLWPAGCSLRLHLGLLHTPNRDTHLYEQRAQIERQVECFAIFVALLCHGHTLLCG